MRLASLSARRSSPRLLPKWPGAAAAVADGHFRVGNILSAMARPLTASPSCVSITGLPHGAYFGVAAIVAASMVPVHKRARAVGRVMLGLTIATLLLGTPLATFFGQSLDWRWPSRLSA